MSHTVSGFFAGSQGAWIREQRASRGWSKAEMSRRLCAAARALGWKRVPGESSVRRCLNRWEDADSRPDTRWTLVICDVLGIPLDEFPARERTVAAVSLDDPRAWARLAATLLQRISDGEMKPGDLLPGVAVVSREAGVSPATAWRAYTHLAVLGAVCKRPGAGGGSRYQVSPQENGAAPGGEQLTGALRLVWESAYVITVMPDGTLEAWRIDGTGTLCAETPEQMRDMLRDDWARSPVTAP